MHECEDGQVEVSAINPLEGINAAVNPELWCIGDAGTEKLQRIIKWI